MRLVFFGTPEFAVPSLEAAAVRHDVAAVVAQPDRPQGRSNKPVPPPTKVWAESHHIPCVQPAKLNDGSFEAWLRRQTPEICVLVAYGRILKQPLLDVPPHGFLNVHPSLLPRHRGPSPIQTALLEGDQMTGVTVMKLDAGMDTGPILLQEALPVLPDDTTETLSARLARAGAALLLRALDLVASGEAQFAAQPELGATVTKTFVKEDGRIRWAAPARQIHNLVRAAVPWPVAYCKFKDTICRIYKTDVVSEEGGGAPGVVTRVERDRLVVSAGRGELALLTIQMPGKRVMPVGEFLRGRPVVPGDVFEDV